MTSRSLIVLLYVVLLSGLSLGAGALYVDARAEYDVLKRTQAVSQARLAAAEAKLHEQETVLERLKSDPKFMERVLRDRLHYAKPDEVIFRFEN
jgi:cell division protein FtsB